MRSSTLDSDTIACHRPDHGKQKLALLFQFVDQFLKIALLLI